MNFDYAKTTIEGGVNSEYGFNHEAFILGRDFLPARIQGDELFHQCLDVAQLVQFARAKSSMQGEKADKLLKNYIRAGNSFQTELLSRANVNNAWQGAFFVEMDDPSDLFMVCDRAIRENHKPSHKFEKKSGLNFVDGEGNVWDEVALCMMRMALAQAFSFKWERMQLRPEELVHRVLNGNVHAPNWFKEEIAEIVDVEAVKKDARAFTVYDVGSPKHCSDPAGHGAVAGATYALLWLKYGLWNQRELREEVAQTCLSFAHCRTLAGVHYKEDNINGFMVGVETVKRSIGDILKRSRVSGNDIDALAEYAGNLDGSWVK